MVPALHSTLISRPLPTPLPPPLPDARVPIAIRPGTMEDIAFLDALQKKTTKQVGWMPTKQFEGKIKAGHVLIAETNEGVNGCGGEGVTDSLLTPAPIHPSTPASATPVGYLIGNDQYFKRDDVGIIYQINVVPEMRRSLVAASLLKAQFERSAYGCRLYCCWCAQDIEANRFWESMGFVALAFRAGSEKKSRVHIFWQKRIRAGDDATPWWFPSQTSGGSIREDRIVLPIRPGTHWSDAKPILLPNAECGLPNEEGQKALSEEPRTPGRSNPKSAMGDRQSTPPLTTPASAPKRAAVRTSGLRFAPAQPVKIAPEKPKRSPKRAKKNNPEHVAAARELRDRWLEAVNDGRHLITPDATKYEVGRLIDPDQRATKRIAA